ncbi:sugar ABC transporter ATP-binding protein [Siculibacillus lacustris]|nr:sugar ABC transporter ATP-binding protein [Siculibacillus lacustris]
MAAVSSLVVEDLVKAFQGNAVLTGVSLRLEGGRVAALSGLNGAGKSTVIKILAGVLAADGGRIVVDGREAHRLDPAAMKRAGIEVIFQDFALFPNLTVAENVTFGDAVATPWRLVRRRPTHARARDALALVGADLDPEAEVGGLPIADRQLVAIARALAHDARFLVLDEPTASLTHAEVQRLFAVVADLKRRGVAILFISHRYAEVAAIADEVFVLRDGAVVRTFARDELTAAALHEAMTGAASPAATQLVLPPPGDAIALEAVGLGRAGAFAEVDLTVRAGEIVGLTGLLGAGKTELAEVLFGLARPDAGEIRVAGRARRFRSDRDAVAAGLALVPEDRLAQGLVLPASVRDNVALASLDRLTDRLGLVDRRRRDDLVRRLVGQLQIRVADVAAPVARLSGGNQQRVVLAKWLATDPAVLILDGPTVGVDVAARGLIYDLVRAAASRGIAVLLISNEVEEVWSICHRVHVMTAGRVARAIPTAGGAVPLQTLEASVHG